MEEKKATFQVAGTEITVSTGVLAPQAMGSMLVQAGGTSILVTTGVDKQDAGLDYFPLSVEYIEKMYASGQISGSRFNKREGHPNDDSTIKARFIDHSIRSLFPKSFKKPVAVIVTVLSYDGKNDPESLLVLGASLSLMQSGLPFTGPCSNVVAGINKEDEVVINPKADEHGELKAEFVISARDGRVLCLEGWGEEIPEEKMDELVDESMKEIEAMNAEQTKFMKSVEQRMEIDTAEYPNIPVAKELIDEIKKAKYDEIKEALFAEKQKGRYERVDLITNDLIETYSEKESEYTEGQIKEAVDYVARAALREGIMKEDTRVSGRKMEEIREMSAKVDILPTVHGSATFTRGLTQSLSIATIAPLSFEQTLDGMEGEATKTFMHHYNMPGYANGEAGRFRYYAGRREVGHGQIGENALMKMIPATEEFPYALRVVSEIMSSNGSTSMAATCAASMALMAAGVPLKNPVGAIGVGLVTEDNNEENYKLILDIEGIEDFYGDMDFKVCGTKDGITAIQYENKLQGVPVKIIKETFRLAKSGREQVLDVMNKAIKESRSDMPDNAPSVGGVQIPKDSIGELIGPGGKNIRELQENAKEEFGTEVDINIDDDGKVLVSANSKAAVDKVKEKILAQFKKPDVGEIYDGVVDKIMDFGAFVNVESPNFSGLLHKSNISTDFVKDVNDHLKEEQKVRVKLIKVLPDGKKNFSMEGIEQE